MKKLLLSVLAACSLLNICAQEVHTWTLDECIQYALTHNVQIDKARMTSATADVALAEAKAARMPSLSASISQSLTYRPFQETGGNFVNGGITSSSADKATESGSYGVNASWTLYNGGRTRYGIRSAELQQRTAELSLQEKQNSLTEQIAQTFVEILYMQEALNVNRSLLQHDKEILARGEEMLAHGLMARADVAQLQSQVAAGEYDVVNTEAQIADKKVSLKQLLELPLEDEIAVVDFDASEARVLETVPARLDVYRSALTLRPEIASAEVAIEAAEVQTKTAKAQRIPTISLQAGLGDSHMTGSSRGWGEQMKNNFNATIGLGVSIPIFDNRAAKSAIERAQIQQTTARLDLQDAQKTLFTQIENYHVQATTSRAKYISATAALDAQRTTYELMSEQFSSGLKNIAELLTARSSLFQAEQTALQDKYTALLNRALLDFYATGTMAL